MPAGSGRARLRAASLKFCLFLLLFGFGTVVGPGQTAVDGAVRGSVADPSGAVLSGVTVRIRNPSTAFFAQTVTGRDGSFLFVRVPPGEYSVATGVPGFAAHTWNQVVVEVGGVRELNIRLGIAGAAASISVDAREESSPLETPSPAASMMVGQGEMHRLPLADRRWQNFALFGATVSSGDSGDNLLSFRGLAVTQNSTSVDGMSDDQSFNAVPRERRARTAMRTAMSSSARPMAWG